MIQTSALTQIRLAVALASVVGLSACASSLQDFQAMSPEERATVVCQRQADVVSYQGDIQRWQNQIRDAQRALQAGVRKERQCQWTKVRTGSTTTCETVKDGNTERVVCEQEEQFKNQQQCREVLFPINVQVERANIDAWRASVAQAQGARTRSFDSCYRAVLPMSAEQAYERYR